MAVSRKLPPPLPRILRTVKPQKLQNPATSVHMDVKKLRSSLKSSAEEFLTFAAEIDLKGSKPTLKTLIWGIPASSAVISSLPISLHRSISLSVESFKKHLDTRSTKSPSPSPSPPPPKRLRRSSRSRADKSSGKDLNPGTNVEGKRWLKNLHVYTHVVHSCVSHPKKLFSPSVLLPSAQLLHDNLILYESDTGLMLDIASLCEEWWREGLVGRETLISLSLPYLVSKSLQSEKKVDLHRVYALREALCLFDFNDESIEDMKHLLIRCVVTSLYLKIEEGRRFVAFLFGLNSQLMKETLAVIRTQIPFGKKSILEAFGEILFGAWKGSVGFMREELETGFLQGLVEGAIYAKSEQLAASIRRVLGGFISKRTADGVEKLLFRLVEPVLFRSLQVANSNVRQNALYVLLDMFPLEDPDATKEAKDTLLDKQFYLLDRLLVDECPGIRVVAVEGACRILCLFWEVIPPPAITKMLTKIVDDMTQDLSKDVRFSVLNGIIYLLDNPHSHEILRVLLPRLQHMFLNDVPSVQEAVIDLLLALRDIRTFQFTKVVGLDALLSSLANDSPAIARKISKLLITSYFPSRVTSQEASSRCVALIKRSPLAGARFCEFALLEGSSLDSLMELMRVCVELALSQKNLNPGQIDGLFLAAANLSHSLLSETSTKSKLDRFFSGKKLRSLLTAACTSHARTAVLRICATVSPENIAGLQDQIIGLITNSCDLHDNVERQEEVRAAHRVIFSCGRFYDLFEALTNQLQVAASRCQAKSSMEMLKRPVKRKKMKTSGENSERVNSMSGERALDFEVGYGVAASATWQIEVLLQSPDTRKAVLESPLLNKAISAIKVFSRVCIEQSASRKSSDTMPIVVYLVLAMYTSLQSVEQGLRHDGASEENNSLHAAASLQERTTLDNAVDHLLLCIKKLFSHNCGKSCHSLNQTGIRMGGSQRSKPSEAMMDDSNTTKSGEQPNSCLAEGRTMLQTSKIVTSTLKFVSDGMSTKILIHERERALQFISMYFQYIIAVFAEHSDYRSLFNEIDLKELLVCLRSSLTYAAKIVNVVLTNSAGSLSLCTLIADLVNNILDLLGSIESFLGLKHASHVIAAMKPWLPDLILGLGCCSFANHATEDEGHNKFQVPAWLMSLAESELCELKEGKETNDELELFPALHKLMGTAAGLLRKGQPQILDAVGAVILRSTLAGVEVDDLGLVVGLLHFVCLKLIGPEYGFWEELEQVLDSLKEINMHVERRISDPLTDQASKERLYVAKELLQSVGLVLD